jgi:cell division transport system ATP-binding protein
MQSVINIKNADIFQKKNLVLSDVSFEIATGELVYLVGKTGSGKSSLLKTLYADLPLHTGTIHIADYDLHTLKNHEIPLLRRKLGIVFQDFQLLTDRSVKDNLLFVLRATGWSSKHDMDSRIAEVLDLVGLKTKDFKMPYELSGGEQQRVVIARALLNNPIVMIADEPTGNLDPDTSQEILKLLMHISQNGTAVLMATHDYLMIDKFPGRILQVQNGKIIDLGSSLH